MPFDLPGQDFFQQRINQAIAGLLASDPGNAQYMASLNGTMIAVEASQPEFRLLLAFAEDRLQIRSLTPDEQVQLCIKGSCLNLAKLLNTQIDSAAKLRQLGVVVSGDVGLLLEMSQLANKIEIDWEYLLSEQLGETPAVLLSRATRLAKDQAGRANRDIQNFIHKQLSERSRLPTRAELDETRQKIRELGYRLDRLELAVTRGKH